MTVTQLDERGVVEACPKCGQLNRLLFSSLANRVRCGRCKSVLPPLSTHIEIGEESAFDALLGSSSLAVLVDFWADWCGPCKMMAPEVEKFAADAAGHCAVAKVNTELLPAVAQRHGINALPTLVLFVNGTEVGRAEGARSAAQVRRFVSEALEAR
jgi:thioredoxin 2